MLDKRTYDDMLPLIMAYLDGTSDKQDEKALTDWVSQDSDHQSYFIKIKETWILNEVAQKKLKAKTRSFSELLDKHQNKGGKSSGKTVRLFDRSMFVKIAAATLLLFAAVYFISNFIDSNEYSYHASELMATTELPDQSEVILAENAKISYNVNEVGERRVKLDGSAYFTVTPDPEAPFKIDNEDLTITVLGTAFFVNNLSGKDVSTVSVSHGSVSVSYNNTELVLTIGEEALIDRQTKTLTKRSALNNNYSFFKTKTLSFEETELGEVIRQINQYYNTDIELEPSVKSCKLTGVYKDKDLETLINIITKTLSLESQNQNGIIHLTGNC